MKSQERRDDETVTIFAGLLLFGLVTAVGAVGLTLVHQAVALPRDVSNILVYALLGGAAAGSGGYVYRHR